MSPETARPAIWDSRPGLEDLRVAAESEASLIQNPSHAQARALAHECFAALHSTQFADLKPLVAAGISWRAISVAVPAHTRIEVSKGGIFEFDEAGGSAFVMPVRV